MGMDFRVLVWKRVCKITFLGLKSDKDLKNRAAHPHEEFSEVTPRGYNYIFKYHLRSFQWAVDAWRWIEKPFKVK